MKNNKYKILVLSDMKDNTVNTIKSGISMAKMIDGDLHFFHVKKPTEIVDQESQLSAIRTINRSYLDTGKNIEDVIEPLAKDFDISIKCNHAFGNVKSEINGYIQSYKPDVIVLGKRKSKTFNFTGDNVTDFVMKHHDGAIIIASEEKALEPNKKLSLGILNNLNISYNPDLANSILSHTHKPLKAFKTEHDSGQSTPSTNFKDMKTVELVFDNGSNSIKSLSNYLRKSDVNLLCIDRGNTANNKSHLKNVISNVNVCLLISEGKIGSN